MQLPEHEYTQKTYGTLHQCVTYDHIGETIVCNGSDCVLISPNHPHLLSKSPQKNDAVDLHEPSCSSRTAKNCRKSAKLFMNGHYHITSGKSRHATAVIRRLVSPNILSLAFLPPQNFVRKKIWIIFKLDLTPVLPSSKP